MAPGLRKIALGLNRRISVGQSFLQEGYEPITLTRDCSAASSAPWSQLSAFLWLFVNRPTFEESS
ncbi:MAG: hypothetical protein OXQ29_09690 [Rhodospirillaceae bacterium]|nr:hypothetical protein [Rhodospirillaceae bacterium]